MTSESERKEGPFRCPRCGTVTWGALDHCSECGMYLYTECPKCTKRWRYMYDYPFCPDCGTKVEGAKKASAHK